MNISTQNLIDLDGSVQLKPGQRMVRVAGSTWIPVGVGGNFMPGASQGISTSDATAGAGDILNGKTAYVNGEKITGTISSYTGSSLIIPGVEDKVLSTAEGIYLPKAVKVAGESELLAENIKKGVSIYGIVGTLEGGGTSAEYYKCASISSGASQPEGYTLSMVTKHDGSSYEKFDFILEDPSKTGSERRWFTSDGTYRLSMGSTRWCVVIMDLGEVAMQLFSAEQTVDNPWDATSWYDETDTFSYFDVSWTVSPAVSGGNTWSGYKAVFDSSTGTWSFESNVTEGLTYTNVTPIVGGIYSPDALVTVSMLYDGTVTLPGCVFYAELKDNTSELKSGQTLTIPSSATFQTIGGVQCVQLNGTDQITFTPQNLPSGNVPRTYCFWNYLTATPSGGTFFGSKPSGGGGGMYYQIEYYMSGYNWSFGGNNPFRNATAPLNQWNFVAVTYNGNGVYYLYVNKTKYNPSNSTTLNTKLDVNFIGPLAGYYAKARIFDYCLSESEIGTMVDNGL